MSAWPALALALLVGGCVPARGGFADVEARLRERLPQQRLVWDQDSDDDRAVAALVDQLLARELTLAAATQIALVNNRGLQAVYERLGVAQAELVQAGLLRNPSLAIGLGFPVGMGILGIAGSLVQEFIDAFSIPLRKKVARAAFAAAQAEVADAVLGLAAEVRAAFFSAQAAREVAAMRAVVTEAARAAADLAARQERAGNLNELDQANEQGLYAQAKLEQTRAEAEAALAREKLTRLLGLWGRATEWSLPASLPPLPPSSSEPSLDGVEAYAVSHRFDLAAARAELETRAAALGLVRSFRALPLLGVGVSLERSAEGYLTIGPTFDVELPIFDQRQAEVARLVAEARAAKRRLEQRGAEVRSEVRAARIRLVTERAVAEFYRQALVPIRERIVKLSQQQYNAMLIGVFQLLQAKQAEINAYRDYIEAVRDYWIARSDLERAAGGPLEAIAGGGAGSDIGAAGKDGAASKDSGKDGTRGRP